MVHRQSLVWQNICHYTERAFDWRIRSRDDHYKTGQLAKVWKFFAAIWHNGSPQPLHGWQFGIMTFHEHLQAFPLFQNTSRFEKCKRKWFLEVSRYCQYIFVSKIPIARPIFWVQPFNSCINRFFIAGETCLQSSDNRGNDLFFRYPASFSDTGLGQTHPSGIRLWCTHGYHFSFSCLLL